MADSVCCPVAGLVASARNAAASFSTVAVTAADTGAAEASSTFMEASSTLAAFPAARDTEAAACTSIGEPLARVVLLVRASEALHGPGGMGH